MPETRLAVPQTASAHLRLGDRVLASAEVSMTPLGLIAVGGLVAAVLLSIPPIIRAAGEVRRLRSGRGDA